MKPIFRPIACNTSTGSAGLRTGVLLVGELHRVRPVAGRAAVAGRVIDQLEIRCRPRRCRSSWARRRPPGRGRARWASRATLFAVSIESLPPM